MLNMTVGLIRMTKFKKEMKKLRLLYGTGLHRRHMFPKSCDLGGYDGSFQKDSNYFRKDSAPRFMSLGPMEAGEEEVEGAGSRG